MMDRSDQKLNEQAARILQGRIKTVTKVLKANLDHFSKRLLEERLIAKGRYDPEDRVHTKLESATILYDDCMTAVEINHKKFSTVLNILREIPQLEEVVQAMEMEGVEAGLLEPRLDEAAPSKGGKRRRSTDRERQGHRKAQKLTSPAGKQNTARSDKKNLRDKAERRTHLAPIPRLEIPEESSSGSASASSFSSSPAAAKRESPDAVTDTVDGNVSGGEKQLFLSYSRDDNANGFVSKLKQDLEKRGFSVWMDKEDIPAGSTWIGRIGKGLQCCKGLIAIITNNYVTSVNGTKELNMAHNKRKKIFPIKCARFVDFEQSMIAAGVDFVIQDINYLSFLQDVDDYDRFLDDLVNGVTDKGIRPSAVEGVDCASDNTPVVSCGRRKRKLTSDDEGVDMKGSSSGLDREPTDDELEKFVATEVDSFKSLGTMLGVKSVYINMIEEEERRIVNRNKRVLSLWKEKSTREPTTWRTLIKALQDMEMNRLARKLMEQFGP